MPIIGTHLQVPFEGGTGVGLESKHLQSRLEV